MIGSLVVNVQSPQSQAEVPDSKLKGGFAGIGAAVDDIKEIPGTIKLGCIGSRTSRTTSRVTIIGLADRFGDPGVDLLRTGESDTKIVSLA